MKIPKMAKIVCRQMRSPGDLPNKSPPQARIRMQKAQSGGKCLVQIPGGAQRGMVRAKIDRHKYSQNHAEHSLQGLVYLSYLPS